MTRDNGIGGKGLRLVVLGLALCGVMPAQAQVAGDPREGRKVAESLCASCHMIERTARDDRRTPPDLAAIADMKSTTATALRVFLQTPHGNMPRYQLAPAEMDDVIAFILSLRGS